jgi:hypothetical protein
MAVINEVMSFSGSNHIKLYERGDELGNFTATCA